MSISFFFFTPFTARFISPWFYSLKQKLRELRTGKFIQMNMEDRTLYPAYISAIYCVSSGYKIFTQIYKTLTFLLTIIKKKKKY